MATIHEIEVTPKLVRRLIDATGSRAHLAAHLGVTETTIRRWEKTTDMVAVGNRRELLRIAKHHKLVDYEEEQI